jgi:hypothetical protein
MPWDIRDPSPRGDTDENAVFNAVGQALTEWEGVEVECAKLFAVFVSAKQQKTYNAPAVRAYGSIVGTQSRSKMLQLAAEAYFVKRKAKRAAYEVRFTDLIGEYTQYANRRNEIAHGLLKKIFLTERKTAKGHRHGGIGFYLLPSFYNPKKFKNDILTYRYTSSDIIHYRQEFTKLLLRIGALREQMLS